MELKLRPTSEAEPATSLGSGDRLGHQVIGLEASHAEMRSHLPATCRGRIAVIMFNLGYLPGADQSCITTTASTLIALDAAMDYLALDGVLTVVVYPGHPGGREEATAVREWFIRRASDGSIELLCEMAPAIHAGPQLFALRRTSAFHDCR